MGKASKEAIEAAEQKKKAMQYALQAEELVKDLDDPTALITPLAAPSAAPDAVRHEEVEGHNQQEGFLHEKRADHEEGKAKKHHSREHAETKHRETKEKH